MSPSGGVNMFATLRRAKRIARAEGAERVPQEVTAGSRVHVERTESETVCGVAILKFANGLLWRSHLPPKLCPVCEAAIDRKYRELFPGGVE